MADKIEVSIRAFIHLKDIAWLLHRAAAKEATPLGARPTVGRLPTQVVSNWQNEGRPGREDTRNGGADAARARGRSQTTEADRFRNENQGIEGERPRNRYQNTESRRYRGRYQGAGGSQIHRSTDAGRIRRGETIMLHNMGTQNGDRNRMENSRSPIRNTATSVIDVKNKQPIELRSPERPVTPNICLCLNTTKDQSAVVKGQALESQMTQEEEDILLSN